MSFVLMLALALALAYGIEYELEQNALRQEADSAADQVETIVNPNLVASDLSGPLSPARYAQIDALIRNNVLGAHIVRAKIWSREGLLLYSDDQQYVGERYAIAGELGEALDGRVATDISSLDKAENAGERGQFSRLMEVYIPLRLTGTVAVAGAYEIYHDLSPLEPHIAAMRAFVWLSVGVGFLLLYGSLFTLVRNASRELVRRHAENARLYRDLSASYDHTLDALAAALDARDKETEGHSRRVVAYTLALARQLNVPLEELATLRRGALLHDIGKIGVPDSILLKPGPLDDDEWSIMRQHPESGERILSGIPFLESAAQIVCTHQERWDGRGYPGGLLGTAIPLGAGIFAVADTFDAITSDRPYRAARPYAAARREIERVCGTQFDPQVVEAFLHIPEAQWTRLRSASLRTRDTGQPLPMWADPDMLPAARMQAVRHELEAGRSSMAAPASAALLAGGAELSGVYGRRILDDVLAREYERSVRYEHPLALIVLELDDFKAYDEAFGRAAGDVALRQAADLLVGNLRATDVVVHYANGAFALVLPETDLAGARSAADKVHAAVAAHEFPAGRLTASAGVAHRDSRSGGLPEELLLRAEQALDGAKQRGGNGVLAWNAGGTVETGALAESARLDATMLAA